MDFSTIEKLKEAGFTGFKKASELLVSKDTIPKVKGVYCVVYFPHDKAEFLNPGVGGFFKGKDPNVQIETLKENWIINCPVVYIGKAGGSGSATLRSRLNQYLKFGQGHNVGHRGGRYIWQLKNHRELLFCWFETPKHDPGSLETKLLKKFHEKYGKLPFANLKF
jgi:hypothetical protein